MSETYEKHGLGHLEEEEGTRQMLVTVFRVHIFSKIGMRERQIKLTITCEYTGLMKELIIQILRRSTGMSYPM